MNKYHARPTVVDNIRFHSAKEAEYYTRLRLLLAAGKIRDLQMQVKFPLEINGTKIGAYIADFTYYSEDKYHVVDVKGYATAVYRLKKRLVKAIHHIDIEEV